MMPRRTNQSSRIAPMVLGSILALLVYVVSENMLATMLSAMAGIVIYWLFWHLDEIQKELRAIRETLARRQDDDD